MKTLICLTLLFLFILPGSAQKLKEHHFPQVGWTISFPETFELADEETMKEMNSLTSAENAEGMAGERQLFLLTVPGGIMDMMESNISPVVDSATWITQSRLTNSQAYELFAQRKNSQVDTLSSTEVIGGIVFNKFNITVTAGSKNTKVYLVFYNAFVKGYDLGVNFTYSNEANGEQMIKYFRQSKFKL